MCFAIADDAETLGKLSERDQAILIFVYNLSFTVLKIRKKTALYLIVNTPNEDKMFKSPPRWRDCHFTRSWKAREGLAERVELSSWELPGRGCYQGGESYQGGVYARMMPIMTR